MRFYFSSDFPCALRTGGAPVGFLHGNTLSAELVGEILTELIPVDGNFTPVSFVCDDRFANSVPDGCEICRCSCYTEIHVRRFLPRRCGFRALVQGSAADIQATVFECGETFLCVQDRDGFDTFPLPDGTDCSIGEETLGTQTFLRVFCEKSRLLLLFDRERRCVFREPVQEFTFGETLRTEQTFADIAGHTIYREYSADENGLHPTSESIRSRENFSADALDEKILPFAFFQELLVGGDCTPYLCDSLRDRAPLLKEFLGNFSAVRIPQEQFYRVYGMVNGVGLVYPRGTNLYELKFFRTELSNRKITNILSVEK